MSILERWKDWLRPPPPPKERAPDFHISQDVLNQFQKVLDPARVTGLFKPYNPLPGVVPKDGKRPALAMDDASGFGQWSGYGGWTTAEEGQQFLGFPILSVLAQRAENRLVAETFATEATRNWISLTTKTGKDDKEKLAKIEREFKRLGLKDQIRKICEHDCYFGRAHLFLDLGDKNNEELKNDIGDGLSPLSKSKMSSVKIERLVVVEPVWVYPQMYNTSNPFAPDYYKPTQWWSLGTPVHKSRFLTFVSREVPDILKPSYAFAGLSTTQMIRPYVDNWLDVRQAVTDITKSFSSFVLSTNMAKVLAGGAGDKLLTRIALFTQIMTNNRVMAIDKENEEFHNVSAPITGLEGIQAQALEHIAAVTQIPLVKLTGISPSGLNASGDQEMMCWEDRISSYQESFIRPNLEVLVRFIQLSLFGDVDEDIGFKFNPLEELTEQEEAELRKAAAETGEILIRSKAVSSAEERTRVINDLGGAYRDLDPDLEVPYPMTENEKADYATKIAAASASLVAEGILSIPNALREIQKASAISGFGEEIDEEDITEAENNPPSPSELDESDGGTETSSGATGRGVEPKVTKGVKAVA